MKSSEREMPRRGDRAGESRSPAPAARRKSPDAAGGGLVGRFEFRLLAEQTLVGIAIRDAESTLYVNARFAEIFGYSRDEFIFLAPDALVAEKDRERIRELLQPRRESPGHSAHYTFQGLRKDGSPVEIESYVSPFEIGGKPATITIAVDITERKRADQALRDSRNMLQLILDSIPSAVFWKDRQSVYLGANRVFLQTLGLKSSDALVGKTDYDLPWGREQADSYREYDRKVMDSGVSEEGIIESYRRADGSTAWALTNKVPLRDADGRVIGSLGTYEDITERKRAEEQVRQQLDELRRWYQATLGREDRVRELKAEVNALCARVGEAPRYAEGEPAAKSAPPGPERDRR